VATYNAEWLFDGVDDRHGPSTPLAAHAQIDDVGGVLRRVDADVLALIEVEHCGVAARVAAALGSASGGGGGTVNYDETAHRTFVAASQDTSHRQTVALLSRAPVRGSGISQSLERATYPVPGSKCGYHPPRPKTTGLTKHLYAVLTAPGTIGEILLVAVHFKARPTQPKSCAKREAQASIVEDLVLAHGRGRHVIVMGDFNDFDGAVGGMDRSSNVPTSNVLSRLTRRRDGKADAWPGLFSVGRLLPQAERATWSGPRFPDAMFDFILVSEGLRERIGGVWVDRNESRRVSDHQPLVVKFRVE
jgi:endonuclease/exonuclease/phosphatase family metal-dependent hydrolase